MQTSTQPCARRTKHSRSVPPKAEDSADLSAFARCWNEQRFFEAHETLEPRWIRERDRGLQGLIQLAAALHHLKRANLRGARTMLQRALPRLLDGTNPPCAIDQAAMAAYGQTVLEGIGKISAEELIAARPRLSLT